MRLLICTQTVDLDDPVLGFFHRWIEQLAKRCDRVHVICLKEGRHELPANVFVHSLGKEKGPSRINYLRRFYRYIRQYRGEYDAVFVHMNQEYVLLGALLWKFWGKKVSMWRNHYAGSFLTSLAVFWCNIVFCTSKHSYTAKFKKTQLMPIGIDTEFFSPSAEPQKPRSILFLGRLDPSKRIDLFIRALERLYEHGVVFTATIIGNPSDPKSNYAHDARNLAAPLVLEGVLEMRGGVTNAQARDLFRAHSIYCNLSPQGMFDKTIGEAMASGCVVVTSNEGVRSMFPENLLPGDTLESVASALRVALELSEVDRRDLTSRSRRFVERDHSLSLLTDSLAHALQE